MRIGIVRLVAGLLGTGLTIMAAPPAGAQEPRNHIPFCASDSFTTKFVAQVRYLVAGSDSASRARQTAVGLRPMRPEQVDLVVDDAVCVDASVAYARHTRRAPGMHAPFPVAVVRAGDRLLVQLIDTAGRDTNRWEVLVFDRVFHPVGRYGGG